MSEPGAVALTRKTGRACVICSGGLRSVESSAYEPTCTGVNASNAWYNCCSAKRSVKGAALQQDLLTALGW